MFMKNNILTSIYKIHSSFKIKNVIFSGPIEFEAENISLTSLNAATAISGGPPSDISDRSANSDKLSIDKGSTGNKKENSGTLLLFCFL